MATGKLSNGDFAVRESIYISDEYILPIMSKHHSLLSLLSSIGIAPVFP